MTLARGVDHVRANEEKYLEVEDSTGGRWRTVLKHLVQAMVPLRIGTLGTRRRTYVQSFVRLFVQEQFPEYENTRTQECQISVRMHRIWSRSIHRIHVGYMSGTCTAHFLRESETDSESRLWAGAIRPAVVYSYTCTI